MQALKQIHLPFNSMNKPESFDPTVIAELSRGYLVFNELHKLDSILPTYCALLNALDADSTRFWPSPAFNILTEPLVTHFRYHFMEDSNRPTGKLFKPEWYLSYVLQAIQDRIPSFFYKYLISLQIPNFLWSMCTH